jgi:hypothetical protein
MRKLLYGFAWVAVLSSLLPAVGAFSFEFAKDARWIPATSAGMNGLGEWLVEFANSQVYSRVLVAALAFAVGIGVDWAARRAEGSRFKFYVDLATRLEAERERLVNIRRLDAGPDLDNEVMSEMTRAYSDQIALQKTLQDLGFKVPWVSWEEGTGMGQYLSVYTDYFAILSAHLKAGHIREAKTASKRVVNWGSGKGPYLKYGGSVQRLY